MYSISMIVPFYNGEEYVDSILECIRGQSFNFDDIELVMVDDNSTDNTWHKLVEVKNRFSNVKILKVTEENGGIVNHFPGAGISRNVGILNASGKYVMFLDQDDSMEENTIQVLYDEISANDVDFVKSNYSLLINNVKYHLSVGEQAYVKINPSSENMRCLPNDMVWGCIYDKQFLLDNNILFPGGLGEDNYFIAGCISKTKKDIILLNDFYSVIYTADNQNSYSHDYNISKIRNHIQNQEKIMNMYIENNFHRDFIDSVFKLFCLCQMSNVLRSSENYSNKKIMIDEVSSFFKQYSDYEPGLTSYWDIFYKLFLKRCYKSLYAVSVIINTIFNSNILSPIQNMIRQKGWNALK